MCGCEHDCLSTLSRPLLGYIPCLHSILSFSGALSLSLSLSHSLILLLSSSLSLASALSLPHTHTHMCTDGAGGVLYSATLDTKRRHHGTPERDGLRQRARIKRLEALGRVWRVTCLDEDASDPCFLSILPLPRTNPCSSVETDVCRERLVQRATCRRRSCDR